MVLWVLVNGAFGCDCQGLLSQFSDKQRNEEWVDYDEMIMNWNEGMVTMKFELKQQFLGYICDLMEQYYSSMYGRYPKI